MTEYEFIMWNKIFDIVMGTSKSVEFYEQMKDVFKDDRTPEEMLKEYYEDESNS